MSGGLRGSGPYHPTTASLQSPAMVHPEDASGTVAPHSSLAPGTVWCGHPWDAVRGCPLVETSTLHGRPGPPSANCAIDASTTACADCGALTPEHGDCPAHPGADPLDLLDPASADFAAGMCSMSDAHGYRMARSLGAVVLACVLLGTLLSDGVSPLGKWLVMASLGVPALLLFVGVFGARAYQRVTGLASPRGGLREAAWCAPHLARWNRCCGLAV